jgi:hypothetical protein
LPRWGAACCAPTKAGAEKRKATASEGGRYEVKFAG